ncbi:MAG: hypothetical protein ACYC26_17015 [Phycisphaerales bacterium]
MSLWTAVIGAGLLASGAQAASDTWNVDANGNWNVNASWLSGTQYPNGLGDVAMFDFNITAPRTVTLTAPITLGGITFNDPTVTGGNTGSGGGYSIAQGVNAITLDTGTAGFNLADLVVIDILSTNTVGHRFQNSASTGKLILVDNVKLSHAGAGSEFAMGNAGGVNRVSVPQPGEDSGFRGGS